MLNLLHGLFWNLHATLILSVGHELRLYFVKQTRVSMNRVLVGFHIVLQLTVLVYFEIQV